MACMRHFGPTPVTGVVLDPERFGGINDGTDHEKMSMMTNTGPI
jgi:hypothetical protein